MKVVPPALLNKSAYKRSNKRMIAIGVTVIIKDVNRLR